MTFVLVHGGGFGASCWDLLVPLLPAPVLAIDLPGRGDRPADLAEITIADFVDAVVGAIVDRDLRDVVLVGHSLAGVTLPDVVGTVPERLRHVVFVSTSTPPDGGRIIDTLDPEIRALAEAVEDSMSVAGTLDPEVATERFCNDMDEEQTQFTLQRLVPEAARVIFEPVSLRGLAAPVPRTYVRLTHDAILTPEQQDQMIGTLGGASPMEIGIAEIDAGHMVMISRPQALAQVLRTR